MEDVLVDDRLGLIVRDELVTEDAVMLSVVASVLVRFEADAILDEGEAMNEVLSVGSG